MALGKSLTAIHFSLFMWKGKSLLGWLIKLTHVKRIAHVVSTQSILARLLFIVIIISIIFSLYFLYKAPNTLGHQCKQHGLQSGTCWLWLCSGPTQRPPSQTNPPLLSPYLNFSQLHSATGIFSLFQNTIRPLPLPLYGVLKTSTFPRNHLLQTNWTGMKKDFPPSSTGVWLVVSFQQTH